MTILEKDFEIETLQSSGHLSALALSSCSKNKITYLSQLIAWYEDTTKYKYLIDCDLATQDELEQFYIHYQLYGLATQGNNVIELSDNQHVKISAPQMLQLQLQFTAWFLNLSTRARRAIEKTLTLSTCKNVLSLMLNENTDMGEFKYAGAKSAAELQEMREKTKKLVAQLTKYNLD